MQPVITTSFLLTLYTPSILPKDRQFLAEKTGCDSGARPSPCTRFLGGRLGGTIIASDHVREHAHFCHGAFFQAFDQVASHTAVEGVVAALETAPGASQAL